MRLTKAECRALRDLHRGRLQQALVDAQNASQRDYSRGATITAEHVRRAVIAERKYRYWSKRS